MGRVSGKIALVTGGGSGIGKGSAELLAKEGATVVVTDIVAADAKTVADGINKAGGVAISLQHDVTDEKRWVEVMAEVKKTYGKLHILFNNAGICLGGMTGEQSLEDWRKQNAVNLDGVFLGTKHGIPLMRDSGGGSIIITSSIAGLQGSPGLSGYCASKGGVRLYAKAVAMECARAGFNIRVNTVHPGVIETPIWTKIPGNVFGGSRANAIDPNAFATATAPLKRAGKPLDIANGVLFLASDESAYMTGSELVIDGGLVAG